MADNKNKAEEAKTKQIEENNKIQADLIEAKAKEAEHEEKLIDKEVKSSPVPKTETAAKEDVHTVLAQETEAGPSKVSGMDLGTVATSSGFLTDEHKRQYHPNDVKFDVTNPKGTSLQKGIQIVSRETAEHFEKQGFGHIVK